MGSHHGSEVSPGAMSHETFFGVGGGLDCSMAQTACWQRICGRAVEEKTPEQPWHGPTGFFGACPSEAVAQRLAGDTVSASQGDGKQVACPGLADSPFQQMFGVIPQMK